MLRTWRPLWVTDDKRDDFEREVLMKLELGNKIKQLRLQKGVTQDTLAKALNVSYQTVSKWENGDSLR